MFCEAQGVVHARCVQISPQPYGNCNVHCCSQQCSHILRAGCTRCQSGSCRYGQLLQLPHLILGSEFECVGKFPQRQLVSGDQSLKKTAFTPQGISMLFLIDHYAKDEPVIQLLPSTPQQGSSGLQFDRPETPVLCCFCCTGWPSLLCNFTRLTFAAKHLLAWPVWPTVLARHWSKASAADAMPGDKGSVPACIRVLTQGSNLHWET